VVDAAVFAAKAAAIRDALERIRGVLPASVEELEENRTAREVVILNLFVAIQDALALATHWLSDGGWVVPHTYSEVFRALAEHDVIDAALAGRLAAASGLRNLIAHQYGSLDMTRLHAAATQSLDDLAEFAAALARKAGRS